MSAAEHLGQCLIAAAEIKNVGQRPVLLKMRQQETQQKALAAAGRPEDGGMRDVLVVQVEEIKRVMVGLQEREVLIVQPGIVRLAGLRRKKKCEVGVICIQQPDAPEVMGMIAG